MSINSGFPQCKNYPGWDKNCDYVTHLTGNTMAKNRITSVSCACNLLNLLGRSGVQIPASRPASALELRFGKPDIIDRQRGSGCFKFAFHHAEHFRSL